MTFCSVLCAEAARGTHGCNIKACYSVQISWGGMLRCTFFHPFLKKKKKKTPVLKLYKRRYHSKKEMIKMTWVKDVSLKLISMATRK